MTNSTTIILYISIGIFTGVMSGIFGIGGGAVRIPLLNLAGLPLLSAFGINLFVIPFSSFVGALSHRNNIATNIAVYVIIGGIIGSVVGALFVGVIPTLLLAVIFFATALVTVCGIYIDKIAPSLSQNIRPNSVLTIGVAFFLNLITGLRGGSGGSLFPPFLKTLQLNIHQAIATSLFVTIFTSMAATGIYWHRGNIVWAPAIAVLGGSLIGARIGSRISVKTQSRWLEIGLSLFVVALAFITIYKALP
jgi:uncharacterized membrane protein YfcA